MTIGEISTSLPVGETVVAAACAAVPVAGAASFADRLAAALGAVAAVDGVATPGSGEVAPVAGKPVPAGAAVRPAGVGAVAGAVPGAVADPELFGIDVLAVAVPVAVIGPDGPVPVAEGAVAVSAVDVDAAPEADEAAATGDPVVVGVSLGVPAVTVDAGTGDAEAEGREGAKDEIKDAGHVAALQGRVVQDAPALVVPVVPVVPVVAMAVTEAVGAAEAAAAGQTPAKPALKAAVRAVAVSVEAAFDVPQAKVAGVAVAAVSAPDAGKAGVQPVVPEDGIAEAETVKEGGVGEGMRAVMAEAAPLVTGAAVGGAAGAVAPVTAQASDADVAAKPAVNPVTGPVADSAGQAVVQSVTLPAQPERAAALPLRTDLAGWEQVLTERIAADLSEDGQEIELSLNPEKLGPLRIKLDMADGLATVRIITATPEAARVFTEAQHRLSEGLARAGIDLGSASAQSEAQGGGQGSRQGGQADDRAAPRGRMNEFLTHSRRVPAGDAPVLRRAGAGLVNLMA